MRTAGHTVNDMVLASLEFAVLSLRVPLVVVMGHSKCGALSAALSDQPMPGHIAALTEALKPAVAIARIHLGDVVDNAIRANVHLCVTLLRQQSTILQEAEASHQLKITPAYYELHSGRVELLPSSNT